MTNNIHGLDIIYLLAFFCPFSADPWRAETWPNPSAPRASLSSSSAQSVRPRPLDLDPELICQGIPRRLGDPWGTLGGVLGDPECCRDLTKPRSVQVWSLTVPIMADPSHPDRTAPKISGNTSTIRTIPPFLLEVQDFRASTGGLYPRNHQK